MQITEFFNFLNCNWIILSHRGYNSIICILVRFQIVRRNIFKDRGSELEVRIKKNRTDNSDNKYVLLHIHLVRGLHDINTCSFNCPAIKHVVFLFTSIYFAIISILMSRDHIVIVIVVTIVTVINTSTHIM